MNSKMLWFKVFFGFTSITGIWIILAGTPELNTDIPPIDGLLFLATLAEERWGNVLAGFGTIVCGFLLAVTSFLPNPDGGFLSCDGDGGD